MKKLTQKEREEAVTKGYLEDQNFVTKEFLLAQNFITKDYLDIRLQELSRKLRTEVSFDFKQYLDSLMEHQMHQLEVLMEQMDDRYVLRREWEATK